MSNKIPIGATVHYEQVDGKWFAVWGPDFFGDPSGRIEVRPDEVLFRELGIKLEKDTK